MIKPEPSDWNTWDVQYHTAAVHLPSTARIRVAIVRPDGTVMDDFTWRRGLVRLGHHSVDGRYAEVTVGCDDRCCGKATARIQFARGRANELHGAVELTDPGSGHHIEFIVDSLGAALTLDDQRVTVGDYAWPLTFSTPITVDQGRIRPDGNSCRFSLADVHSGDVVDAAKREAEASALASSGWLGDSAAGYARALTWNTVIRSDLGRVITPTSRDFVSSARDGFYGTWALHCWDTFFSGLTATWLDHDYARGIFDQILEQATPDGFLPNRVSDERGRTDDRSQPPVGAYTVLKSYLSTGLSGQTRDISLLTEAYPILLTWHDWWPRKRRGPHGALAWGSDPTDDPTSASVDNTRRESGLDDSPMYDTINYDPVTHTMDLADVGLNALHAADAEALAEIADLVGDPGTAQRLRAEHAATSKLVEEIFWDDEQGHYRNRKADGSFSVHLTPTMLYPMLAGVPSAERARRLIDTVLVPELLGGSPPLPSVSRSDPGYNRHYCRGRIWGPVAFLVVEGLRRYRFDAETKDIVGQLLGLFREEWEEHGHVHENYFSSPDEDIHPFEARSDYVLTWGNLLAYLAMQELADPRPSGWRFAHPGNDATLSNMVLREGRLSIEAGERLHVTLDAVTLIDAPPSVVIEDYERTPTSVRATVLSGGAASLRIGVPADVVHVRIDGGSPYNSTVDSAGTIGVDVLGAQSHIEVISGGAPSL